MNKPNQFRSQFFLRAHIEHTLAFYHPNCIDDSGGFFHYFLDNGQIYNRSRRHLVSSCRFVFNYAMAVTDLNKLEYLPQVIHGINFIEQHHRNPITGGYYWEIEGNEVLDDTNHCYGLAFVLLAHSVALKAGVSESKQHIDKLWDLLEQQFWLPNFGLYADESSADFSQLSPYRGQNANMHMCEAMLTAFEATKDSKFLNRAHGLAKRMTIDMAATAGGMIWEHYDPQWQIDWQYNIDNPKHLFRPWGFQPGHQTEWAKLLMILYRHKPEPWMVEKAEYLFTQAVELAWDNKHQGLFYGVAPDKSICDDDKYFWVQAESFAAAATLALTTNNAVYWQWYDKIWQYAWQHMIDHKHGAWYRILTADNQSYSTEKSPAGKTDYHTMGACYEVLRALTLAGK